MFRKLWATSLLLAACHAGWLRWKRVRGRRRQTASSQPGISLQEDHPITYATYLKMSEAARANGTLLTPASTSAPSSLLEALGAPPPHIPEQRTRFVPTTLEPMSPGWLRIQRRMAPEGGPTAGPEGPSHD